MKITVLVDNNSIIDRYLLAEPALSFFIEVGGKRILFDAGYSDVFIRNAKGLGLSIRKLYTVILSHKHIDHTRGIVHLTKLLARSKKPRLICHPLIFQRCILKGYGNIGLTTSRNKLSRHFKVETTATPLWITRNLVFLGQIPRRYDFERAKSIGKIATTNGFRGDFLDDDSSLAYKSSRGLVIMTGCAHSGICNTIEYAREVCGEEKIAAVIGGFHLLKPSKERLKGTLKYFKSLKGAIIYPCHCTDLRSKIAMSKVVRIEEVGAGMEIRFN